MGSYEKLYKRPFYERVWFIVLMFLVFWPVGLVLLVIRVSRDRDLRNTCEGVYRKVSNATGKNREWKRSCKTQKIIGGVLLAAGACTLIGLGNAYGAGEIISSLASGIGLLLAGGIVLMYARDQVARWDRYESYINNVGNTPIGFLAEKMGYSDKRTRADVQSMINRGFFTDTDKDLNAYINGEYDLLVMTVRGEPFEPLRRWERPKAADTDFAKAKAGGAESGHTSISYIDRIHDEIKRCSDSELISTLCEMEGSIRRIETRIIQEPDLAQITSVKQMYESYLPQAMEFVKKFNDGEGSESTMAEIKCMMKTCARAFRNIEEKVNERDDTDTKVDMEVLKRTLEREGLLDSDFDLGK